MFSRFNKRSNKLEHLDKGDYTPEEYEGCLVELRRVNAWLGDTRALRETLFADIEALNLSTFSVLDVGAGSGELLRTTANWAKQSKRHGKFVGVELNARSAAAILEESRQYPEISSVQADGFRLPFVDNTFDYAICSLITHHFPDSAVVNFLVEMNRLARRAIFVIDLHRNPIAYYFYVTVGRLLFHNRLIREDGALSILRSFKPEELEGLAHQAQLKNFEVLQTFPSRLVLVARRSNTVEEASALVPNSVPTKVEPGLGETL
jgi:ubiquinone/menaquinone biosynthesis C-methylase UbiE